MREAAGAASFFARFMMGRALRLLMQKDQRPA